MLLSLDWMRSIRTRMLLIIVLVAAVPVALMGLWFTGSASRSSQELLEDRMAVVLGQVASDITSRWVRERSLAQDIADDMRVRQAFDADTVERESVVLSRPVTLRDTAGRTLEGYDSDFGSRDSGPTIPLRVPVHTSTLGPRVGSLETPVPVSTLVEGQRTVPGGIAILVGVFDANNAPLVPLPFDWSGESGDTFEWGGDRWFLQSRTLAEPGLQLVGAVPLTPFEEPLRDTARSGLWILVLVSAVGLALGSVLTRRMTRTLGGLGHAAERVSEGNLEETVAEAGGLELERLARAFNRMTGSLRTTLRELADQRALARVGEFAASLAHEIRNPLTAIRVDLQVVEENLPEQSSELRPLRRALGEIDRLDDALGSALTATKVARRNLEPVDVRIPIEAAAEAARKTASGPVTIPVHIRSEEPILVPGDVSALEQVFLNLLLNAVEATSKGGDIEVTARRRADSVQVSVRDSGAGLQPGVTGRVFEPFFTTSEDGTGLGLTIALRLARAHGGSLELESAPEGGTTATVTLPVYRTGTDSWSA